MGFVFFLALSFVCFWGRCKMCDFGRFLKLLCFFEEFSKHRKFVFAKLLILTIKRDKKSPAFETFLLNFVRNFQYIKHYSVHR
jgi:hypothetical protein